MFLLSVYTCISFYSSYIHTCIFTIHLSRIMTEVRSKRRFFYRIQYVPTIKRKKKGGEGHNIIEELIMVPCMQS